MLSVYRYRAVDMVVLFSISVYIIVWNGSISIYILMPLAAQESLSPQRPDDFYRVHPFTIPTE